MENLVYAVQHVDENGDEYHDLFDSPDALGQYVKVNSRGGGYFKISVIPREALAANHIREMFDSE